MNIGVIGLGGIGGYFGGKICRWGSNPETQVHFVARGPHLAAIQANGLQVDTATDGDWVCHPASATDRISDLPPLDLILVCVKSYDLQGVVRQLNDKISPSTIVLPLLNGVDIYERIRQDMPAGRIFPACVYIGTRIESPGKVVQSGGPCEILMGNDPRSSEPVPAWLLKLLDTSHIAYTNSDNVDGLIWKKYMFIAAFGMVTAAWNKTFGQIMESTDLSQAVLGVMTEINALASCKGIHLPDDTIQKTFQKGGDFPYDTKTSFQRDFERPDRPDERDLFGGTILRLGDECGVKTPISQELWQKINQIKPL